jgi:hypothetical protein
MKITIEKAGKLIFVEDKDREEILNVGFDASAMIQYAINYLIGNNGGKIEIKNGKYEIEKPIKVNKNINIKGG